MKKLLRFIDRSKPLFYGSEYEYVAGWLMRFILKLGNASGITIGYIWYKDNQPSTELRAREFYHYLDQNREGLFRFLAQYVWEYVYNRVRLKMSHTEAYLSISAEQDARWYASVITKRKENE